jgi:hypothetical protein
MATRIFMTNPGEELADVTQDVGSATATKSIELTVDLANVLEGSTKPITREDVLLALDRFEDYIATCQWPPA